PNCGGGQLTARSLAPYPTARPGGSDGSGTYLTGLMSWREWVSPSGGGYHGRATASTNPAAARARLPGAESPFGPVHGDEHRGQRCRIAPPGDPRQQRRAAAGGRY